MSRYSPNNQTGLSNQVYAIKLVRKLYENFFFFTKQLKLSLFKGPWFYSLDKDTERCKCHVSHKDVFIAPSVIKTLANRNMLGCISQICGLS